MQQRYVFSFLGFVTTFLVFLLELTVRVYFDDLVITILSQGGFVIAQILAGEMADKYGGKHVVGLGILGLSILSLIFTIFFTADTNRILNILWLVSFFFTGLILPGLTALISRWASLKERTLLGAFVFSGTIFGTAARIPLSKIIFKDVSWVTENSIIGACGIVFFIIWLSLCYNSPTEHPFISDAEKNYLRHDPSEHVENNLPPTPWKHVLTSVPLWALVAAQIGYTLGHSAIIFSLNDYFKFLYLYLGDYYTSFYPYIGMWLSSLVVSWLADRFICKKQMSVTNVRKICISVGTILSGITTILTCNMSDEEPSIAAVLMLVLCYAFLGIGYSSFQVNAVDLSPSYAATIVGITNGISSCVNLIFYHLIINVWKIDNLTTIFYISFATLMVTNIIYFVFGSGKIQRWNNSS